MLPNLERVTVYVDQSLDVEKMFSDLESAAVEVALEVEKRQWFRNPKAAHSWSGE